MQDKEKQRGENPLKKLRDKFYEGLDVPADLLAGGCTLEIRGRSEAYIGGCRRIAEFRDELIRLEMSDFDLIFEGERLECPCFCAGKIAIAGYIKNIIFDDEGR